MSFVSVSQGKTAFDRQQMTNKPVSERCDDQTSRVAQVFVGVRELCVDSTLVQVLILKPVVPEQSKQ